MSAPGNVDVALVAPRYLAGGGDPAWITAPLHRACDWSSHPDPLVPRVVLTSPGKKAVLRLAPDPDHPWWTLQHASLGDQRAWSVSFGARAPVEIIAGLTDALTDPAVVQAPAPDPYQPLRQAGWLEGHDDEGLTSPDGLAHVEHFTHGTTDCWFAKTAVSEDPEGLIWRAYLSGDTPAHLITGFTRALADQAPLPRDPYPLRVPLNFRRQARVTTTQLPSSAVGLALERRVTALANRSKQPVPTPLSAKAPPPRRTR
ncbi:DUF317 domain-containing protein [Streptomyces nigrescens]|uniref:DUF317 domain-containing protein n=1 Tax=Streptomyces nigrescens TaxID=1920 RepID=A0ABY7J2U7_STRNI|nr:DUF317 domain-containing protein [Streptomyces nigrescens]WAU04086.1 DUF317 domain-containing protein [Streptomyces nigrescens]